MNYNPKMPNPVVFFDLETTGVNTDKDRIIDITIIRLEKNAEGNVERSVFTSLVNPKMEIPAEVTKLTGLAREHVQGSPIFLKIADKILEMIQGATIVGYNCNKFDVPILYNEFQRNDINWNWRDHNYIDAQVIFMRKEERTLAAASRYFLNKELEGAHGSFPDTQATLEVLNEQLNRYPDLPDTAEELNKYCNYGSPIVDLSRRFKRNEKGEVVFAFGKYINQPAADHTSFLMWMQGADFSADTLWCVKQLLNGELK